MPRKCVRGAKEGDRAVAFSDPGKLKSTWTQCGGTQTQQPGECSGEGALTGFDCTLIDSTLISLIGTELFLNYLSVVCPWNPKTVTASSIAESRTSTSHGAAIVQTGSTHFLVTKRMRKCCGFSPNFFIDYLHYF